MSGPPEDPDAQDPAQRLQAALDRIAHLMEARSMDAPAATPAPTDPAVLQRLDSLILQLRGALDE